MGSLFEVNLFEQNKKGARSNATETMLSQLGYKQVQATKLKGSLQVVTIVVKVDEVADAFSKICTRLKVVDENCASFTYPQRTLGGGHDDITVQKDEYLEESLMTFFLTCEEGSKIIVEIHNNVTKGRPYCPKEDGYNTIITPNFTVDIRFSEYLQKNVPIIEKFLVKCRYTEISLWVLSVSTS